MAMFATPEWIDEMAARAAEVEIDHTLSLTIEQHITGSAPATWGITLADGRITVRAGAMTDPQLRLTCDHSIAEAIHAGTLSAQRAFLDGALQVGGDIAVLIAHRDALDTVAGLSAGVT